MLIFLLGGDKVADKRFNLTFDVDANIGPIKNSVSQLQNVLKGLNVPQGLKQGLEGTFAKLNEEITNFQTIAGKGFSNMGDINKAEKSYGKITDLVSRLRVQLSQVKGLDPKKFLPEETLKRLNDLGKSWDKLQDTIKKSDSTAAIEKQNKALDEQKQKIEDLKKANEDLKKENQSKNGERTAKKNELKTATEKKDGIVAQMKELEQSGKKSSIDYRELSRSYTEAANKVKILEKEYKDLDDTIKQNQKTIKNNEAEIKILTTSNKELEVTLNQLKTAAKFSPEGLDELRQKVADLKGVDISQIPTDIDTLGEEIKSLENNKLEEFKTKLQEIVPAEQGVTDGAKAMGKSLKESSQAGADINARANDIEQLANRVKYFFSLTNSVMLFRRAIKSAINTIKELDEVMTQTAVVTKFTVADMWGQLPEYTKRANELGVSIKGVYEASTLYYQQGLKTNEVIGVANETLKLAKIAGLDYATATDYMTSALRGFNMEVNELSAKQVNDIYSQLAANTASNVEEISIAMSKVAPLAHNAGMEIETTAAMLAQMIEKTREAPETLGTAMKTVIARFQELKKAPSEIEEIDGEIVDANKVEKALRTVGISLRDTSGQFRELDDVFLELSSKWDTLDTNTQRYIATIAAGSRQQSRFIAMMADYKRTMDLVQLANTSAGASQRQFEKTLDSMETKLEKLKNAWNEFTMGIANNAILKAGISLITSFINTINRLTSAISGKSSIVKSFLDIGVLVGAIKLGKTLFTGFFGWLVRTAAVSGKAAGAAAGAGFSGGINKTLQSTQKLFSKATWVKTNNTPQIEAMRAATANLNRELSKEVTNETLLNAAITRQNAARAAYAGTLTLTNSQQEIANLLTESGVAETDAMILATSGLTKTEAIEFITSQQQKGGTEAVIRARIKDTAAIEAERIAEEKQIETEQVGILTKAKAIIQLLFFGKEKRADAMKTLGMAAADKVAEKSQWSLNAAMAACPIGWIIVGLGAIVGLYVAISKAIKKNSLENQMKKAAEETKKAAEAADKAKEAYNALVEDKSKYDEIQDSLSKITYGTLEWKQALFDANEQVLGLIEKYSYLSNFVEKGEYGQLIINEAGWKQLQEWQEAGYRNALAVQTITSSKETQLKKKLSEGVYSSLSFALGKDEKETEDFANILRDQLSKGKTVTFEDIFGSNQNLADQLISFFNLSDFIQEDNGKYSFYSAYNEQLEREKVERILKEAYNYIEDTEQITLEIAKKFASSLETVLPEEAKEKLSDSANTVIEYYAEQFTNMDPDSLPEFNPIEFKEQYEDKIKYVGGSITGDTLNDLQVAYAALNGLSTSMVKETYTDIKELESLVKKSLKADQLTQEVEDFADAFNLLSTNAKKALTLSMSGGRGYRKGEESSLSNEDLKALYDNNKAYQLIYGGYVEFTNAYELANTHGQEIIKNKLQELNLKGIPLPPNFLDGFEAQAIESLSNKLLDVFKKSGSIAAGKTGRTIQQVLEKVAVEDQESFVSIINSTDWGDVTSIQGLSNAINNLGIVGTFTKEEIDDLEKQIISTAKATKKVDLEKINEEVTNLSKIQYNLKQNKTNSFSEEEYKALIDAGVANAGDFVYNLATDSWNYISGSMETLSTAINDNTKAILGIDNLESQVESSRIAKLVKDANPNLNTNDTTSLYDFIGSYITEAGENNYVVSFEQLRRDRFNIAALQEYVNQIMAEANAYETRKANLDNIDFQTAALKAQSENDPYSNFMKSRENNGMVSFNENSVALSAQAQALGVSAELIDKFNKAILESKSLAATTYGEIIANISAIYQEAEAWEIDKDKLNEYAQYLAEVNELDEDHIDEAYKLALAQLNLEAGLKALNDGYSEWSELLKAGLLDKNIRKTGQYEEVLSNTKKALRQLTNSSEEASNEFFQEAKNLKLVENALTGNKDAIKDLQKALALDLDISKNLNGTELENQINNILNDISLQDIEVHSKINNNEFLNGLYDMMIEAGAGVEDIQNLFNTLGWEPDFEKIPISSIQTQNQKIKYPDPAHPGEYIERDVTAEESAAGFITVPTKKGGSHNFKKLFDSSSLASVVQNLGDNSGGGGSEKEPEWENPYDKLYNITKQINGELRIREQLEKRYQRLLNTHAETGKLLKENIDQQIASLEKQNKLQEEIRDGRLEQIKELEAENSDLLQYARFDETIGVGGEIQIDWDLINDVDEANDEELGKRIEDYISKMEEWADSRHEAIDAIEDNTDAIIELQQTGKEEYKDLEDRALDAIINHQQNLIDEQEKINDSINEANEALTDAISKNIEKIRQDRQNQETETSLAEKERRLAYLRQDTTGSNAVEIKKLEKDLEKERQNYTDSLIDQSLNDLKEQNDAAAKQREKQIELMQSQLDEAVRTGAFADQATDLVKKVMTGGFVDVNSDLYNLLVENEDYYKMTNASRKDWFEQLQATIAEAFVYSQTVDSSNIMESMISAAQSGNLGIFEHLESQRNAKIRSQGLQDEWPETNMYNDYKRGRTVEHTNKDTDYMQKLIDSANSGNWSDAFMYAGLRDRKIEEYGITGYASEESFWKAFKMWYDAGQKQYLNGGLADFTGPAWLDGTKSRPEMVLNARDTQNFLELRDILSSMAASGTGNSSVGNFYCDIDINVGEISNDYDVDRIAARIKQSIYEDSTYRNVNAINFLK